jgi:hypothetical protein
MDTLFRIIIIPSVVGAGMLLIGAPLVAVVGGCAIGAMCAMAGCGRTR